MIPSSPTLASTSSTRRSDSSPLGPFTRTVFPSTFAVTPFGRGTGFLPIRDILLSSKHAAENFAAHVLFACRDIRHHALRRGHYGKPEALPVRLQFLRTGIDATTGRGHALQLTNDRTAIVILQLDFDLLLPVLELDFGIAADEAFRLQHIQHASAQLRSRALDLRCAT